MCCCARICLRRKFSAEVGCRLGDVVELYGRLWPEEVWPWDGNYERCMQGRQVDEENVQDGEGGGGFSKLLKGGLARAFCLVR